jgi:ABC-type phosphate transport system substrate-binding protein
MYCNGLGWNGNMDRLASNSVDFALSDGAQNLQDGITTTDMTSIPFAAQALVVVYNLPGNSISVEKGITLMSNKKK